VLDEKHAAQDLEDLSQVCDEPATDIAALAQWALYRRCQQLGFRVALSGLGADEMLFGYPDCNRVGLSLQRVEQVMSLFRRNNPHLSAILEPHVPYRLAPWLPVGSSGFLAYGLQKQHRSLLTALDATDATFDARLAHLGDGQTGLALIYALQRNTYLTHNGLQLADKLGMGNSVEVRVPFVDHCLWATADGLPLNQRFSRTSSKPVLRKILQHYLPASVWAAPKRGFSPPPALIRAAVLAHQERTLSSALVASQFPAAKLAKIYQSFEHTDRGRWFLFALTASVLSSEAWSA
jgi:asparagine synthase (glutamine-hydrolysing)